MGDPCTKHPKALPADCGLDWGDLQNVRKMQEGREIINTELFFTHQRKVKPNGILELFNKYCGKLVNEIREDLIDYINENREEMRKCSETGLQSKDSFSTWVLCMTNRSNPLDNFALFILCKMYFRHSLIIYTGGMWTTLETSGDTGENELRLKCDITLIQLRNGNTGFGLVTAVTPDNPPKKLKPSLKLKTKSMQSLLQELEASHVSNETRSEKLLHAEISHNNIIPDSGKCQNTRPSSGARKRHSNRPLRKTFQDVDYQNLDVKTEDDDDSSSPNIKKTISSSE